MLPTVICRENALRPKGGAVKRKRKKTGKGEN